MRHITVGIVNYLIVPLVGVSLYIYIIFPLLLSILLRLILQVGFEGKTFLILSDGMEIVSMLLSFLLLLIISSYLYPLTIRTATIITLILLISFDVLAFSRTEVISLASISWLFIGNLLIVGSMVVFIRLRNRRKLFPVGQ
jgi:hypothetical protein